MARAVTLGTRVRGGARAVRFAAVTGFMLLAACSGGGKDRSFELPSGDQFDSVRAGKVLAVVEAQNECGDDGPCVTPPAGPCHLGRGNTRGIAIYRLGQTGLLLGNSAEGAVPEQRIPLDNNPRRVVVNPKNPSILYVSTQERVQVVRLQSGGGSACIDETDREQDVRPDADDMDPVDMVVDPTIGNGILYVATRGSNRVDAYPLAEDGTLPSLPTSCIVGGGGAEFTALTPLGEGFFAAGGSSRIEIHSRILGQFLPEPDPNATTTPTPAPTVSPTPAPGETPGSNVPSPEPSTCFNARLVTTPLSVIGSSLVTQLLFQASASEPLGQLFISEEVSQRIFTFPVNADGVIAENDSSSTQRAGVYQRMLRHRNLNTEILYSSVYNEGRIDVFQLEDGLLPDESFSRTAEDPNTLPVGLIVDEPGGTILYVAQAGRDRVDGFRIRPDGGLDDEPVTTTARPVGADGHGFSTFPDDLVIVPLP